LLKCWRQLDSPKLARLLHLMRTTIIGDGGQSQWPEELQELVKLTMSHKRENDWVTLTGDKKQMDKHNDEQLALLPGHLHHYDAVDWHSLYGYVLHNKAQNSDFYEAVVNDKKQQSLFSACSGMECVKLKAKAYVVCTRTFTVNGLKISNRTFETVLGFVAGDPTSVEQPPDQSELDWWAKMHSVDIHPDMPYDSQDQWPVVEFKMLNNAGFEDAITVVVLPARFEIQDVDTGALLVFFY
jgi:hypothetical protein